MFTRTFSNALMAAVALVVIFAIALFLVLAPSNAQAAIVTIGLDTNSSGAAPSSSITPWVLATVDDGNTPGSVTLTSSASAATTASEEVAFDFFQVAEAPLSLSTILGDMNGDFIVTIADAPLLVEALVDRPAYDAHLFPVNPNLNGDVNQDGTFDLGDLRPFSAIPEPGSAVLALLAIASLALIMKGRSR